MPAPVPPGLAGSLRRYRDRLVERFGARVRFVRLFGSWARGEADERSDVDVAVVIEGLTRDEWRESFDSVLEADLAGDEPFTPFVLSGERFDELLRRERRIALDILREGIPI